MRRENSGDPPGALLFTGKVVIHASTVDVTTSFVDEFCDLQLGVQVCASLVESLTKFTGRQLLPVGDPCFRHDQATGIRFGPLGPRLQPAPVSVQQPHREARAAEHLLLLPRGFRAHQICRARSRADDLRTVFSARAEREHALGVSFCVHQGRPGDQWYHFNDSVVSLASRDQSINQNFGGQTPTAMCPQGMIGEVFRPCDLPPNMRGTWGPCTRLR